MTFPNMEFYSHLQQLKSNPENTKKKTPTLDLDIATKVEELANLYKVDQNQVFEIAINLLYEEFGCPKIE